jgi:hypothetical protein
MTEGKGRLYRMEKELKEDTEKRNKMFDQVNRIVGLPDINFRTLLNEYKQSHGDDVVEVLQLIYHEKDMG